MVLNHLVNAVCDYTTSSSSLLWACSLTNDFVSDIARKISKVLFLFFFFFSLLELKKKT
jgi:hypothetical protein